ncbi:tetratricopeptide repeat protein [Nocardia sp. NPDC004068]|uniref:tetratricopeptide repeat protein n=1 Tax=Nocardia sp. NPDC004068 TaxID=3364303 RepID=UPI003678272D
MADDLLELIIQPALEKFDFRVVRADKIASAGLITAEILELVQSAELCIIDLTGHNANVFYECGRRHENARPFIQLIKRGEKLPFDVAGIRTIHYDLTNPRTVYETQQEVRRYVEAVTQSESGSLQTGVSVASLAEAIDRLERKMDRLAATRSAMTQASDFVQRDAKADPFSRLRKTRASTSRALMTALINGNLDQASEHLADLRERQGLTHSVVSFAALLGSYGEDTARAILFEALDNWPLEEKTTDGEIRTSRHEIIQALAQFYISRDEETEGLARLETLLEKESSNPDISREDRASCVNKIQMLAYATNNMELALKWALKAIELNPDEPAFHYNISLIYESRNLLDLADTAISGILPADLLQTKPEYLEQAYDVYIKRGKTEEADRVMKALEELDSARAQYKKFFGVDHEDTD